jgi:hypothetical protein
VQGIRFLLASPMSALISSVFSLPILFPLYQRAGTILTIGKVFLICQAVVADNEVDTRRTRLVPSRKRLGSAFGRITSMGMDVRPRFDGV